MKNKKRKRGNQIYNELGEVNKIITFFSQFFTHVNDFIR